MLNVTLYKKSNSHSQSDESLFINTGQSKLNDQVIIVTVCIQLYTCSCFIYVETDL